MEVSQGGHVFLPCLPLPLRGGEKDSRKVSTDRRTVENYVVWGWGRGAGRGGMRKPRVSFKRGTADVGASYRGENQSASVGGTRTMCHMGGKVYKEPRQGMTYG